jgi:hypothetical protein
LKCEHLFFCALLLEFDLFADMSSITNDDGVTPKIEAAVPKAVSALPCKYGSECYRKNPTHLSEFYHPPK